jgi:lipopolysaccharide export system permease protein
MRILDKYLLREFALPLLYCFDAFLMLWIAQDLLGNLSDFIQFHARFGQVLHYYLIVLPQPIVQIIAPVSLLLAVLFCLATLGKHNELIAFRASGISVFRLSMPLLAVGVLASLLVFGVNEAFVPKSQERADAFMNELQGKGEKNIVENFFFFNSVERRDWYARRFNRQTGVMQELVQVYERRPDGTEFRIDAETARWIDGGWRFYVARINGGPLVAETNFPSIREPPKRLALEGRRPEELSSSELRRYIRALQRSGSTQHITEYQVTLHYRYAFPLTCFIVIWLGIPLGMRVSRSGPMLSVGVALLLVVTFYFMTSITLAMGRGDRIPPALAAWLTNAIFAAVGAVLFARVR